MRVANISFAAWARLLLLRVDRLGDTAWCRRPVFLAVLFATAHRRDMLQAVRARIEAPAWKSTVQALARLRSSDFLQLYHVLHEHGTVETALRSRLVQADMKSLLRSMRLVQSEVPCTDGARWAMRRRIEALHQCIGLPVLFLTLKTGQCHASADFALCLRANCISRRAPGHLGQRPARSAAHGCQRPNRCHPSLPSARAIFVRGPPVLPLLFIHSPRGWYLLHDGWRRAGPSGGPVRQSGSAATAPCTYTSSSTCMASPIRNISSRAFSLPALTSSADSGRGFKACCTQALSPLPTNGLFMPMLLSLAFALCPEPCPKLKLSVTSTLTMWKISCKVGEQPLRAAFSCPRPALGRRRLSSTRLTANTSCPFLRCMQPLTPCLTQIFSLVFLTMFASACCAARCTAAGQPPATRVGWGSAASVV